LEHSDTTTGALISISGLLDAGVADTITVGFVQKSAYVAAATTVVPVLQFIETTSSTTSQVDTSTVQDSAVRTSFSAGESVTTGVYSISTTGTSAKYAGANFRLYLDSASSTTRPVGTYAYTIIVKQYSSGTVAPVTTTYDANIVVSAVASESETPSAAYSGAFLSDASTASPTADSATVNGVATAGTKAANLNVMVRNALNGTTAIDTVTITLTGPGLIDTTSDTKYLKVVGATGDTNYPIIGDGTSGVATIKVAFELTGQTFTKTVTFYAVNATTITAPEFDQEL